MNETIDAPRRAASDTALLIIDMVNDFDFPEAKRLMPAAIAAAKVIATLRDVATDRGVPVVYVNDNYGLWHSDRAEIVDYCASQPAAADVIDLLRPRDDDFFVLKPRFSGFYATNLPVLLPQLGVSRLVLTGIGADICVLFTAADAHMREYALWVPRDGVASFDAQRTRWALDIMEHSMNADTRDTQALRLEAWIGDDGARRPRSATAS